MRRRFLNSTKNAIQYLTFEALEDGFWFSFPKDLQYRIDGGVWITLKGDTKSYYINKGQSFSLKSNLRDLGVGGDSIFTFPYIRFNVYGNIHSLIYGDECDVNNDLLEDACFIALFKGSRVEDCSGLKLPATTLTDSCYSSMFEGCTSLVSAPELPATTLASYCYSYMFEGCTNLNFIKMLATDISADYCLDYWVYNVARTGTFVKSKDATWDTTPGALGYSGVPAGWTIKFDGEESRDEITFSIINDFNGESKSYQALSGMSWSEWVKSDYNVDGYIEYETIEYTVILDADMLMGVYKDSMSVIGTDKIIDGYIYTLSM